jgi:hypothetical protein
MVVWVCLFTGVAIYAIRQGQKATNTLCEYIVKEGGVRVAQSLTTSKLVKSERSYAGAFGEPWSKLADTQEKNYRKSLALVRSTLKLKNDLGC